MNLSFDCALDPSDALLVVSAGEQVGLIVSTPLSHESVVLEKDDAVRLAHEILNYYGEN